MTFVKVSTAAVLVSRGAPLRVGDARAHTLEHPRLFSWLQMAPLRNEERVGAIQSLTALSALAHSHNIDPR